MSEFLNTVSKYAGILNAEETLMNERMWELNRIRNRLVVIMYSDDAPGLEKLRGEIIDFLKGELHNNGNAKSGLRELDNDID